MTYITTSEPLTRSEKASLILTAIGVAATLLMIGSVAQATLQGVEKDGLTPIFIVVGIGSLLMSLLIDWVTDRD